MKNINKLVIFLFCCITFFNLPVNSFFYDNDVAGGALTGAAIGGIAGGRRGAAIGAGVGAFSGLAASAARSDRRDRYYDDSRGYNPKSRSSMRSYIQGLEQENSNLRNQLDYQRQLPRGRRN